MDPRQLAGLAISAGSVAFGPATPSYEVEVGHDVESGTVPPTGNESEASVRVKGRRWRAGRCARPFPLSGARRAIEVGVHRRGRDDADLQGGGDAGSGPDEPRRTLALTAAAGWVEGRDEVTVTATHESPSVVDENADNDLPVAGGGTHGLP